MGGASFEDDTALEGRQPESAPAADRHNPNTTALRFDLECASLDALATRGQGDDSQDQYPPHGGSLAR
jgi:hypothetical protein